MVDRVAVGTVAEEPRCHDASGLVLLSSTRSGCVLRASASLSVGTRPLLVSTSKNGCVIPLLLGDIQHVLRGCFALEVATFSSLGGEPRVAEDAHPAKPVNHKKTRQERRRWGLLKLSTGCKESEVDRRIDSVSGLTVELEALGGETMHNLVLELLPCGWIKKKFLDTPERQRGEEIRRSCTF